MGCVMTEEAPPHSVPLLVRYIRHEEARGVFAFFAPMVMTAAIFGIAFTFGA